MLYLNSISNQQASIGRKFAICHEKVEGMTNVTQLTPSKELLSAFKSQKISFDEFKERFRAELRAEYRKPDSKLKGLSDWSLNNDATFHSPEENSKESYRCVLAEIIEAIWKHQGAAQTVIDLTVEGGAEETVDEELKFVDIAKTCEFFSPISSSDKRVDCSLCQHYDSNVSICDKKGIVLAPYHWEEEEETTQQS